ncbi:alkaline phosphatase family protein [Terriglobus albidus]|uniref:Alkaline phosphatase family protein n=1 Tax=Terriglobus albidus TaxID=1592106 RepID=A0A5B9ECG3_9BACT|nr:alkaline phosphatase family protein [Terriglobus albidus]QEE28815.1 alkaline phosphatase family protein [Terriglobus albidus]
MRLLGKAVAAAAMAAACVSAVADEYHAKPKLVVILVLDQMRGDYLDRYRDDFKTANGFNLFLKKGAHFTDCYYDYANTHTAPGHSTIGTGAYTDGHGIQANQWWDFSRSTEHVYSSVDDDDYKVVGAPVGATITPGQSPRNLMASTLGDEIVLATHGEAKVFGISLKDRAAILTSGHATQGAFWIDQKSGHFITSTYWMNDLPAYVAKFNASGKAEAAAKEVGGKGQNFYNEVGATPAGIRYELEFAENVIDAEQLGKHAVTDMVTISLSSTDILGHAVGPNDPKQRALLDGADIELDKFFTWLNTHVDGGMANVWVAMSGDHGVAPAVGETQKLGMPANTFSYAGLIDAMNEELTKKLSPGNPQKFLLQGGEYAYFPLDQRVWEKLHMSEADAENMVAAMLPEVMAKTQPGLPGSKPASRPLVRRVFTKAQMASGNLPNNDLGRLLQHSYSPNGGWQVFALFGEYQLPGAATGTTHYAPYSYDRHVPLDFYGSAFIPGTYHDRVAPVDIAATFASLLRINQPSAAVGHVLTQILKPEVEPAAAAPRTK